MNPQMQLCPHCGVSGKSGFIWIHSPKEKRYRCKGCGKTFSESYGTAYYGIKKSHDHYTQVISLLAHGCPVQAIVKTYDYDERTIWSWLRRAGAHCQKVHEAEIEQGHLELGQIQADELKINTFMGVVWMGMVMMVSSRLWLGGTVAKSRGKDFIRQLLSYAARAGHAGELLVSVDGFNIYPLVIPEIFCATWDWLKAQWQGWTQVAIVQTMKQKGGKRGDIHMEIYQGSAKFVRRMIRQSQGKGWINTSFIERLNATFRAHIQPLARRSRALVRRPEHLEAWMWLVGSVYNWCTYHDTLRLPIYISHRKRRWLKRTPAIASELTDHCWSIQELLSYKYPTSRVNSQLILRGQACPRYSA